MKEKKMSKEYWIKKYDILDDEYFKIVKELQQENTKLKMALKEMYDDLSDACKTLPPYEWYIEHAEESINNE